MFNLIKYTIGILLFIYGVSITPSLISFALILAGCFIFSRPFAFECGTGPAYFIIGAPLLFLSMFLTIPILLNNGLDPYTADITNKALCLVFGVFTWLSVPKG